MTIDPMIPVASLPSGGKGLSLTRTGRIPRGAAKFQAYTPTWISSGTAPAIGNGTVVARYAQVGAVVFAAGSITFGSTSTFGTGNYSFSLPVRPLTSLPLEGIGWLYDSSGNNFYPAAAGTIVGALTLNSTATYAGANVQVAATQPFTWAQNDVIQWSITYEAA